MKQFYKILFFTIFLSFNSYSSPSNLKRTSSNLERLAAPSASISGTTTVCQNAASPLITFTGSGGTAPYTFTYTVTGTPGNQTIQTTSGNSVTVAVPTGTAVQFIYLLVRVHDATLPITEQTITGQAAVVNINPQAVASLNSTAVADTFNGFPVFKICSNQPTQIDFFNTSTTLSTNTNYTINWGDTSLNFNSSSNWNTVSHNYAVGLWTLTYSITALNGCNVTKIYKVFVGNNPAVGFGNPGNTDVCISSPLTFPITGTANNPPGTTYTVTFNDGSLPIVFNHPPPSDVTHLFLINSCNVTSTVGTSFQNSFYASIVAENPCDRSSATVVPIRISTPPVANFTLPQSIKCTNSQICFTNTSTGGDSASSTSCSTPKIIWTITPNTGFTLVSGNLGNDFGSTNTNAWTSGSSSICPTFSIPGNYIITMKIGNRCGIDQITKTICIESPLVPQFTLNNNTGCIPFNVTATNTTSIVNQCATPTYLWQVTHTPLYCATTTVTIPNQTSANPTYNFTEPGTYSIRLTVTNSCTPAQTTIQIVTVKKPPTASITAISNSCGSAAITPNGTVVNCAPSGGTLTYAWSFPGGTPSSSNSLNPGTINYPAGGPYSVSLVASNECGPSNTATQTFSVNIAPLITNTSLSQTICSGSTTSLVNLTANPTGTTFSWTATATAGISGFTPSGTTNTIPTQTITTNNPSPGTVTYVITPSVGGCPGPPVNYVITVNPAPAITTQPASSAVCLGGTPTPLTVALNSSSVTPTYQWYSNTASSTTGGTLIPGATNATYNPPATTAGTLYYYCIISLSSGGCSGLTSAVATVTINPLPTITTQPPATQSICVGGTFAALTVAYTGGLGTATYQWFSNTSNATTGGTPVGTNSASFTPAAFTTAGTFYYYVTISLSGNGCGLVTSNIAEIVVFSDPTITAQPIVTQTLCQGATPTNLEVTASGGNGSFTYQWYSNTNNNTTSGISIAGATNATYSPPTSSVVTLYYYCIVSQATPGCSVTSASTAVIVNASPTILSQPQSSTVCSGGTPTLLSLTFSTGAGTPTYQWYSNTSNDTTTGTPISGETNSTYTPPANTVGTMYYYALLTFPNITGSCATIATNTALITVNAGATINQHPIISQAICVGGTIVIPLSVSFTGGTGTPSYQWYSNTSNSNTGGTLITGATNANYTPPGFTTAGNAYYYVIISFSGSGCGAITSDVATIIVANDPTVDIQPTANQTLCQSATPAALSISVSGGIGSSYAYQWYVSTLNNTTSGTAITGETNPVYTPPTNNDGTLYYYCIISQPNGIACDATTNTAAVTVNLAPAIVIQPTSSTICLGQSPTLLSFTTANGLGTPTYQWYSNTTNSNSGGTLLLGATNATYNPPAAVSGTTYYYCVVTFSAITGGCSIIATNAAEVTINQNPVIASEITVICSSTTFTVSPSTTSGNIIPLGTTYTWTAPTINPAATDITGAASETVPQTSISQTLVNTTTSPATATYTVIPTSGICAGNSFTVTVTVNPSINPNVAVINNACFGVNTASISTNITGGIPFSSGSPYQLSWTGPEPETSIISSATSISNIQPGTYNVTIADAGGCPFSNSYTITEPADIVIAVDSENDITCYNANNGSINIILSGGTGAYSYSWTKNTAPYAITEDISNLAPGTYEVSVTDVNNCGPKTASFTITEPPLLVVSLVSQTNVLCYGAATGAINVNVTGGTLGVGYNFSWIGPNGFTSINQNLTGIPAGNYDLTVTDANGCEKNLSVIITQSTEIIIAYTTTPITCYGANNASMSVTLSGGNPSFQFQWSNLSTSLSQNNLSAGNYTITVTDNVGCIKTETIVIPEALLFTVNPVVRNITCFGANDGSINLNFVGGIPAINLVWSDGSTAGTTRNNLGPGTYSVTIIDGTPCTIFRTFTIVEPQPLIVTASLTNAFDCLNPNSGAINLIVSGGTPAYSYNWSNGSTTEDLLSITSGNYQVTVTDLNGCTNTKQYSIIRPEPLQINVSTQTTFDCETHYVNQTFVANVVGGVPAYQLQWSSGTISGVNNEIMQTNVNGTVVLEVTDNIGCQSNYTVNVDTPVLGYASFNQSSFGFATYGIYAIGDPIQFTNTATGDFVSVLWDFGDGTFSTELNPIHTYNIAKDYIVTLTVTYPFGCVYVQTISLFVEEGYVLVVPTAFTPNNDDLNDTIRPVTKRLSNVQMDIYDTWGSLIYSETGDVLVGWDATIKGFNAENGNYYCKVKGETFYGTTVYSNQTFVLIK